MAAVLIVDDEKNYPLVLSAVLEDEGFKTLISHNAYQAIEMLKDNDIDLVLTDMKMPGMDGIELLERIKADNADQQVIMMTAHGTVDKAVEAMQKGAFNYILKPFENTRLIIYINKALAMHKVVKENKRLRDAVETTYSFDNIIGKSSEMKNVFELIRKVAPTNATVLIEGDSGTGKELVAKSIHFNSKRRDNPFVAVDCNAFAESVLESELFGHEKGAFTGAVSLKKGRFEIADKGTLFLDEIGELSQGLQVKLLRVLQERTFARVGGTEPVLTDIRIISATNKKLKEEIEKGNFREDLYYRLNVMRIVLPVLKNRQEDIPLLVKHFIKKFENELKSEVPIKGIDKEAEQILLAYSWPGNVRELENVIERAMIMCPSELIRSYDLPKDFRNNIYDEFDLQGIPNDAKLYDTLAAIEKKMLKRALDLTDNVQSNAAKLLGIGKSGFNKKLNKYKIH